MGTPHRDSSELQRCEGGGVELKVKPFQSEWIGQLSLYVTAVDKLIKRPQDNPTIGILICQKANREKVKWTLEGFNKPMGVSTYTDNLMRMVEEHLDALQVVTDDDASYYKDTPPTL